MSWPLFSLALVVIFVGQTTFLPLIEAPAWIDPLLALAIICGLAAPAADARLAGWLVGFAIDIGTQGPIGLHAFALGLAMIALTNLRESMNLQVWWVRWTLGAMAALPAQLIVRLHQVWLQEHALTMFQVLSQSLASAIGAGLIATLIIALPDLFGRQRRKRSAFARR